MQALEITSKEMEVRPSTISDVKVDASFRKIAKNAMCFHIWKIEEDRLEAEPKPQYGTFLDDCAYIIYAASPIGTHVNQDTITRETKSSTHLERFIHFWLGEKVSEQKRSNVAHKIQELDSYFGNVATEYRETQDNESARFLSYFKKGITIRSGILVDSKLPNRLFQLRGRKWLRCVEVETISWECFGAEYAMLLQTEAHIFVWMGRSCSNIERRDAITFATKMQTDPAVVITIIDDGYEQSLPDQLKKIWNSILPLNQRVVSQTKVVAENPNSNKLKIYKCGYRGARLHLDQLDVVIPTKEDLNDSATAFVLDGFAQGVWLWVGNQASHQDNISAMGNGRAFVKKKKYAYSTPVIRVIEGHEPIEFTRLFPNWPNEWNDSSNTFKPISTINGSFDSVTLCQRPKMAADTQLIDDGSGERIIYRITNDQTIQMPTTKAVIFTTGSCYVVKYTIVFASINPADAQNIGITTVIYQWNGSDANTETITTCENFAKTTFENQCEKTMFVQMCEFDETPHFLQIFDGKLIILRNDKNIYHNSISNYNNNNNNNNHAENNSPLVAAPHEQFVLKIYGDASYNSKASEFYPLSTLSSKECYIIKTNHIWVWCGQSSTGDAREVAKNVGALLGESTLIMEGKEPQEFWRSITSQMNQILTNNNNNCGNGNVNVNGNGNGSVCSNYTNGSGNGTNGNRNGSISPQSGTGGSTTNGYLNTSNTKKTRLMAQLYMIWLQRGKYQTQEILGYEQNDLSPECVYVLDAGLIIYIWLGTYATAAEKSNYMKMTQHYLETVPIARRPTTAMAVIMQDNEPNVFKGFFDNWDHDLWKNYESYEDKRLAFSATTNGVTNGKASIMNEVNDKTPLQPLLLNKQKEFDRHHKYPITTLQQETDLLPAEVNPLKREVHLTHDDFVSIFNLSFWEFDELPNWRKQELKKKFKLF